MASTVAEYVPLLYVMLFRVSAVCESVKTSVDTAAYAAVSAKVLEGEADVTSDPVIIKGTVAGFTGVDKIAGVSTTDNAVLKAAIKCQKITVTVHANGNAPTFNVK